MRITCLSLKLNTLDGGGSNFALDFQLNYLKSRGHDIRLITLFPQNNKFRTKPTYTIIEKYRTNGNFLNMQNLTTEILFAEENDTDIYYLDGQSLLWGGGDYRNKGGTKPVAAYVNNYTYGMNITQDDYVGNNFLSNAQLSIKNYLYRFKRLCWEKLFGIAKVRGLDVIIMNSPVIIKRYTAFGFDPKKIKLLPMEMHVTLKNNLATTAQKFVKKEPEIHLLYAGRLVYDKGLDLLLEALSDTDLTSVKLHIVGDGPQKNHLLKQVKQSNLESRVSFYGWVNQTELEEFYASADVFVHPCRWPEPFGRTILEAMSWGKPIITSEDTGAAWIADGAGKIFSKNNIPELREAIKFFLDKKNILDYGARAKKRALEFDFQIFADAFEKTLSELQ